VSYAPTWPSDRIFAHRARGWFCQQMIMRRRLRSCGELSPLRHVRRGFRQGDILVGRGVVHEVGHMLTKSEVHAREGEKAAPSQAAAHEALEKGQLTRRAIGIFAEFGQIQQVFRPEAVN
jgi:hypothetical protein